jgi:hypothetical protein
LATVRKNGPRRPSPKRNALSGFPLNGVSCDLTSRRAKTLGFDYGMGLILGLIALFTPFLFIVFYLGKPMFFNKI